MGAQSSHQQNGLEIDQDLDFQEKEWRVERVAWAVLSLIVILAALGLFGTGWLSAATAGSDDGGLTVDYERFIRHDGEASLTFEVSPDQVNEGRIELWISTEYIADVQSTSISPQPDEVRGEGDRQVYVFLAEDPNAPVLITFSFSPERMGRYAGEMGIVDGPAVSFTQLSYP